jgi:hypothetical protein
MAKHVIEIEIEPGGIITSEVFGIVGSGCEEASKWIDRLGKLLDHKKTADSGKVRKTILQRKVSN